MRTLLIVTLLAATASAGADVNLRTWTSKTGKTLVGAYVELDGDYATFLVRKRIKLSNLSIPDLKMITEHEQRSLEAAKRQAPKQPAKRAGPGKLLLDLTSTGCQDSKTFSSDGSLCLIHWGVAAGGKPATVFSIQLVDATTNRYVKTLVSKATGNVEKTYFRIDKGYYYLRVRCHDGKWGTMVFQTPQEYSK